MIQTGELYDIELELEFSSCLCAASPAQGYVRPFIAPGPELALNGPG